MEGMSEAGLWSGLAMAMLSVHGPQRHKAVTFFGTKSYSWGLKKNGMSQMGISWTQK